MQSQSVPEIRSLTGLRGVAALYVMLYHYFDSTGPSGPVGTFVRHGYIAVDLFFVLSGYVICLSYQRLFESGPSWRRYGQFLGRRFGRVYPLYGAVLACTVLLAVAGIVEAQWPARIDPLSVSLNLLLVQSWVATVPIILPSWSISTEFAVYLGFPLLLWLLRGRAAPVISAMLAMGILALVATRSTAELAQVLDGYAVRNGPLDASGPSLYPLLRCVAGFVLGMVGFRVAASRSGSRVFRSPGIGGVAAATIVLLLMVRNTDLLLVPAFLVLVVALATRQSLVGKLLSTRPVHWLGVVSYSVYLVHVLGRALILAPLQAALESLRVPHAFSVALGGTMLAVLALAYATYVLVEKPGRDAVRWLLGRRRPAMLPEPSAP